MTFESSVPQLEEHAVKNLSELLENQLYPTTRMLTSNTKLDGYTVKCI